MSKKFSDKAAPLNALLRKEQAWKWTEDCQKAFETLKGEIAARPVSAYPDFSKPFRLYTDASNIGLGAILPQKQQGKEKIICCASRTLNNVRVITVPQRRSVWLWYGECRYFGPSW